MQSFEAVLFKVDAFFFLRGDDPPDWHQVGTHHSPYPSPMIAPARRPSACFQPCVFTVERG